MNGTLAELNRLLAERLGKRVPVTPETELVADLALDSLQQLDLIVELENHFQIALELSGDEEVRTVGELILQIDRARAAAR